MAKLVRVPEAAELLSISPKTLWAYVAARKIDTVRIGRSVRIPTSAIDWLIDEGTTPARVA
jgi:excisionase family DNA binding protein